MAENPPAALAPYVTGMLYPEMKAARARRHLDDLKRMADEFRADPYTVTKEDHPELGAHITRYTFKKIDALIAVTIGEFAYSLRSGLDHLVWQLGLLSGRTPSRSSSFPIHSNDTTKDRERFMRATWDIPCEAVEIIKSLQPHTRRKTMKSDPLWQLNKLCNLDKHSIVGSSHTLMNIRVIRDGPVIRDNKDTQEVEVIVPLAAKDIPHVEIDPPELIFGKPIEVPGPEFWLSEKDIAAIHSYVGKEVLPKFAKFFPGCLSFNDILRVKGVT